MPIRRHQFPRRGGRPLCKRSISFADSPCVDGQHRRLRAEFFAEFADQLRATHRRGVHAHLVRAREQYPACVGDTADPATHSKGNEDLARGARHDIGHDVACIARGGNVEEDQLVRALRL